MGDRELPMHHPCTKSLFLHPLASPRTESVFSGSGNACMRKLLSRGIAPLPFPPPLRLLARDIVDLNALHQPERLDDLRPGSTATVEKVTEIRGGHFPLNREFAERPGLDDQRFDLIADLVLCESRFNISPIS